MTQLQPLRNVNRIVKNLPITEITSISDAKSLCDFVGRCVVPDLRFMVWDLDIESIDPFTITGFVSNPFGLQGLIKSAEKIGVLCNIEGVQILPAHSQYAFGRIVQNESPLYLNESEEERLDTINIDESPIVLMPKTTHSLVHAPNGYLGWIRNDSYKLISHEEWLEQKTLKQLEATHGTLQDKALQLLETPYVWGGVSSQGIDCSGFTRYLYQQIGSSLPRDADQQFACGEICALPNLTDALTAGDLLFFSGECGGISHVGMALSSQEFIHAKGGKGVIISKINQEKELMNQFIFAKRIIECRNESET